MTAPKQHCLSLAEKKSMDQECYSCMSWTIIFFYLLSPFFPLHRGYSLCGLCTSSSPYLLHASPSPLLNCLCMHQYLFIHDLCAPFVPASPHHYLMYHCTIGAHFPPLLHVYYHAPYACLSSISTGQCSALYSRLDFLSNQVTFHLLVH